jgi:phosphate transport system permease protein
MSAHGEAIARASAGRRLKDVGFRMALVACLALAVGLLGVLIVDVAIDGAGTLDWDFITSFTSIDADKAGIQAALWGTVWLMGVCALFIVPVGVATAIYLEEYADSTRWWNRLIELNIQNLAAVPSIVYGILGLAFLVRGPLDLGHVVLAGGLTLALLVLPMVIIAGREALRGLDGARRHPVADDLAPGAAGGRARHRHRGDPRPLARDRRDGAADRRRRGGGDLVQPDRPRLAVHGDADPDLRVDLARVQ